MGKFKMNRFAVALAAMAIAMTMAFSHCAAAATNYYVGDSNGWTNGQSYSSWTTGKTFVVGDTLTFTYVSGMHDVNELSETAYTNCDFTSPIKEWTSGNDVITLDTKGDWYFACSDGGGLHCKNGMKLHVNVVSAAATTTPSPPPPKNSTSQAPPAKSPSPSPPTAKNSTSPAPPAKSPSPSPSPAKNSTSPAPHAKSPSPSPSHAKNSTSPAPSAKSPSPSPTPTESATPPPSNSASTPPPSSSAAASVRLSWGIAAMAAVGLSILFQ